jgi:cell wall assembly regulator SMI1
MIEIQMKESCPPLHESDIAKAEHRMGVTLPDDYRQFLLRHNGGRPDRNVFPVVGDPLNDTGIINWLYSIEDGDVYDLVGNAEIYKGRMPAELLPIGLDPFGNQICLALAGPNKGRVYFWDHEEEVGEDEKPTYENVYFIANSFTEMMDGLHKLVF